MTSDLSGVFPLSVGRDDGTMGTFASREWIARQGKSRPANAGRDEGKALPEANCQ
jgi:hypothetical protein